MTRGLVQFASTARALQLLYCRALWHQVIGKDLHLAAVVGANNLEDAKDDLGLNIGWIAERPAKEAQNSETESTTGDAETQQAKTGSSGRAEAVLRSKGEPTVLSARSQRMDVEASGWRLPNGDLVLRQPATAVLDFTPALAE